MRNQQNKNTDNGKSALKNYNGTDECTTEIRIRIALAKHSFNNKIS